MLEPPRAANSLPDYDLYSIANSDIKVRFWRNERDDIATSKCITKRGSTAQGVLKPGNNTNAVPIYDLDFMRGQVSYLRVLLVLYAAPHAMLHDESSLSLNSLCEMIPNSMSCQWLWTT